MDLNNYQDFPKIDSQNMLAEMKGLSDQVLTAWKEAEGFPLSDFSGINKVIVAGMGGSAIGASLLRAYAAPLASVPIFVHRDYGLPSWATGPDTLVVASSHSGNTEESLSAMETALERGNCLVVFSTNGKMAQLANENGIDLWQFKHKGQPRAAVGYSFTLLLNLFYRLGFIENPFNEVRDAVAEMKKHLKKILPEVPDHDNPAKRLAGQLVGRWVSVFGADLLEPVARRWKGQISEIAKAWGQYEALPEANHNTLAGVVNPEEVLMKTIALLLKAESNHPRNQRRIELTQKNFMIEGINTDLIQARGDTRLAQMWTLIQFGDFTSYYLAMIYEVDPSPVAAIENLKREL